MGNESAWEFWYGAMMGEDIPEQHRSDYHPGLIVKQGGGGSQNIGWLHYANQAAWLWHRDKPALRGHLDAALGYAGQAWMTSETFGSHVYMPWVFQRMAMVRAVAAELGEDAVVEELDRHLLTLRCLSALSAGWERFQGEPDWLRGFPVMMCGSRSFASQKPRRLPSGAPNVPFVWMLGSATFAGYELMRHLRYRKAQPELRAMLGDCDPYGTTVPQRKTLRRICRNEGRPQDFENAVAWINEGPKFLIPAEIGRGPKAVYWMNAKVISPGSTSFLYGKVWMPNGRRGNTYWRSHGWQTDRKVGWLACDGSMRKSGTTGKGEVVERGNGRVTLRCQRTGSRNGSPRNTWHNTSNGQDVDGWFEAKVPGKVNVRVKLKTGSERAELLLREQP